MSKIFIPHELKTLSIDTEKKIFQINGEDFGKGCTGFSIWCGGPGRFNIRMELDVAVRYVHYEDNKIVSDRQGIPHSGEWTDNLQEGSDQFGDTFDDPGEC